ncbi:hypothetical protein [Adhaeretor mobilis]|nr:hypothetical protein [Adhaeretor mobilis]
MLRKLIRDSRPLRLLAACLFAVALAGCDSPSYEQDTAPVSGRVTLDGEPLTQGIVYLLPSKGRSAKGLIKQDGSFVLKTYSEGDGAQVGTHPATVAALPGDDMDSATKKPSVTVPRRYSRPATSGLTVEVKPGENNEVEFALTSKANGDTRRAR